jgi:hypothetical protein
MVWVHVTLATLTWLAVLWSAAAAGSLARRQAEVAETEPPLAAGRELEPVGRL